MMMMMMLFDFFDFFGYVICGEQAEKAVEEIKSRIENEDFNWRGEKEEEEEEWCEY